MSFRHFKRKLHASPSEESSSADEENLDGIINVSKKSDNGSAAEILEEPSKKYMVKENKESDESETEARSESEDDSDSSSTSENEGMINLHRPVFLNKNKRNSQQHAVTASQAQNGVQSETHAEQRKKDAVMKSIDRANLVAKNNEIMKLRFDTNYSTNEELLKQCMLLDDDDDIDLEKEKHEWSKRQDERRQKYRSTQLAKQRELEEYEANRFAAAQKDKARRNKYEVILDEGKEQLIGKKQKSAQNTNKSHNSNRYKVTKAKNIEFGNLNRKSRNDEENEYSAI
ncbi:spp381p [Saccharomyces arboricola H-6]|uniref:Spp381p n=1 Tax=Saccharomyces arboricola (strain H-6 / AS 2.3317 / CBS 10644) TaxID=1160507 RepID=J8Q823_SACAR|nr:spp381p [Saccharomyces arboricola H-6]